MTARYLEPLHYAILRLFTDGHKRSAKDVVNELWDTYGGYKLLTIQDTEEVLETAKENNLLDEEGYKANQGQLIIYYRISEFGSKMVKKYLN